jgi:hypothetical protein
MVAYKSPVLHPASMVDASMHDAALLGLIDCEVSRTAIGQYSTPFTSASFGTDIIQ